VNGSQYIYRRYDLRPGRADADQGDTLADFSIKASGMLNAVAAILSPSSSLPTYLFQGNFQPFTDWQLKTADATRLRDRVLIQVEDQDRAGALLDRLAQIGIEGIRFEEDLYCYISLSWEDYSRNEALWRKNSRPDLEKLKPAQLKPSTSVGPGPFTETELQSADFEHIPGAVLIKVVTQERANQAIAALLVLGRYTMKFLKQDAIVDGYYIWISKKVWDQNQAHWMANPLSEQTARTERQPVRQTILKGMRKALKTLSGN
jgi:hypothetical protein